MSQTISATDPFTAGDLVVSVYGDGSGTGTYADNQAAPITLDELTTAGATVASLELPQTTTTANGTTEYAVSGEYGSSSEGSLQLAANGASLVIMGYGVNAATYNAGESNGSNTYGNAALAQSTSLTTQGTYTPVARVVADIGAAGAVDSSTDVYNVFNTNNPRSVATVNGSTFYISGQGVKGDTTQGVFTVADGASSATAIDISTDTRTVEIYNGNLYVSRDSKQATPSSSSTVNKGTANIATYGTDTVSGATAPVTLAGISQDVAITAATGNSVNGANDGSVVDLSPENFFFANATTLYVADSGDPKGGGLGDGGLQKWSLNTSTNTWSLDYTLSAGLNLVPDTSTSGVSGLIGLTGSVANGVVTLYATSATLADLDTTYVYSISDQLGATAAPSGETFSTIYTAAPDTIVRGIAFAPTAVSCFTAGVRLRTTAGEVRMDALTTGHVMVLHDGGSAPVRWIGRRTIDLAAHPEPELVRPVRVRAGALGENLPAEDLLLSPDHALLVHGALLPVRLLVNHRTIVEERELDTITYYHVEIDGHALLVANGAPAESYLDAGDRSGFADGMGALPGRVAAASPGMTLTLDPALVQPIWRRVDARADTLGLPARGPAIQADIRPIRLLAGGRELAPIADAGGALTFLLPRGDSAVRLVSASDRPSRLSPWLDDRRRLGLKVAAASVDGRDLPLSGDAFGAGWHLPEGDMRWTDGDATIRLPLGAGVLTLSLA